MPTDPASSSLPDPRTVRTATLGGLLMAGVVFVVVLLWAKWLPYAARTSSLAASGPWSVGGVQAGDPPSRRAGTSFASAYVQAVWKARVTALLISAAVQSLVPRRWLLRMLNRSGRVASPGSPWSAGHSAGAPPRSPRRW